MLAPAGASHPHDTVPLVEDMVDARRQLDTDMPSSSHFPSELTDKTDMLETEPGHGASGIWQLGGVAIGGFERCKSVDVDTELMGHYFAEANLG